MPFTGPGGPGYNTAVMTKADVTASTQGGAWSTANTGLILFTVSGSVLCRVYGRSPTAATSTGGTGTLAVGVTGATGALIAATTVNGTTNFVTNAAWVDTTPTVTAEILASAAWTVVTGNILLAIVTNNMTAGAVTLYCDWIPLSSGATVVAS